MAEPEDIIADAARHAVVAARRLWRKGGGRQKDEEETLLGKRRRLELLIAAVFGVELPIRIAQPPAPPSFLRRAFGRPRRFLPETALPGTDGWNVYLPLSLGPDPPLPSDKSFRLLALQQGARALRGSALPAGRIPSGMAADLYLMSEALAVDHWIATELQGLAKELIAFRQGLLRRRRDLDASTPSESAVDSLYRAALVAPQGSRVIPLAASPEASRSWADEMAAEFAKRGGRYRGLQPDAFLGTLLQREGGAVFEGGAEEEEGVEQRSARLDRRPRVREREEREEDEEPGPWMLQMDEPQEHVEDPMGLQRPTDRDAGKNPDDAADSLSELEEASTVATPERAKEVFVTDDPPASRAVRVGKGRALGIVYPEWDHRIAGYHQAGATVWVREREPGDAAWAERVLESRRPLLMEVRRRFGRLKPRRVQLGRQTDGEELDLEACVEAYADRLAGVPADDRLYRTTRPLRRELAILLLIDISGSTDAWVTDDLRIVDVEKEALLVCCHALDALGDPYAIQAFSGEGAHGVDVWRIKGFEERDPLLVQRRIAGLEPEEYTRAGAAIRHGTATLATRSERSRLLLLISDGKPNDADHYGGSYGVEDMRQAVLEATAAGLHLFCLTVDRDAPRYLHRIFGPSRHTTLAHARELPVALVEALRHLIRT